MLINLIFAKFLLLPFFFLHKINVHCGSLWYYLLIYCLINTHICIWIYMNYLFPCTHVNNMTGMMNWWSFDRINHMFRSGCWLVIVYELWQVLVPCLCGTWYNWYLVSGSRVHISNAASCYASFYAVFGTTGRGLIRFMSMIQEKTWKTLFVSSSS